MTVLVIYLLIGALYSTVIIPAQNRRLLASLESGDAELALTMADKVDQKVIKAGIEGAQTSQKRPTFALIGYVFWGLIWPVPVLVLCAWKIRYALRR